MTLTNESSVAHGRLAGVQRKALSDIKGLKIAIIASGLGTTNRGFETSASRWFEALRKFTDMDVRLFCGGSYPDGKKLWNISRNSVLTLPFKFAPFCDEKQRWELCYGTEQISFWSALNFELLNWKPDVIWVKDIPLAHLLLASRIAFGLKFKIVFGHGGMLRPTSYNQFDLIQQISRDSYDEALSAGIPANRMRLISNCFAQPEIKVSRSEIRRSLGFADDDWITICVAAWNKYHKRIDYLLEEFAQIKDEKAKLVLCGAPEVSSGELKDLGSRLLGDRVRWLTVSPDMVASYLNASDLFVLPSLRESLGNAIVEAVLCGLPILTHPHSGAKYAIEDPAWMVDMRDSGNLASRLLEMKGNPPTRACLSALRTRIEERFLDRNMVPQFQEMILDLLA